MQELAKLHWQERMFINDVSELARNISQLTGQSSRIIFIRASYLPNQLFQDNDIIDQLSSFVRESRYRFIHILLDQPENLMRDDSPLLALTRRLSEKIIIKRIYGEPKSNNDIWFISDGCGVIFQPLDSEQVGFASIHDKANHKKVKDSFRASWDRSNIARDLRAMSGI